MTDTDDAYLFRGLFLVVALEILRALLVALIHEARLKSKPVRLREDAHNR